MSRMSSKYQVVVPPSIRTSRGWKPGDELEFVEDDEGRVRLVRVPSRRELRGILAGHATVPFVRDKEHG